MTKVNAVKLVKYGATALGMLLVGFVLSGCRTGGDARFADLPGMSGAPIASTAAATTAASPLNNEASPTDLVQKGDAVTVTFKDMPTPELPIEDRVKEDGTITLLQNQTFTVAGKTRSEIEKEIHDRYVPSFYRTMTVTFNHTVQTRFFFVGGEVKREDRCVYISQMTVLKAIPSAGGFTDFAKKTKVSLIRTDGQVLTVNCVKAINHPELDLPVFPGDKIIVPRRWF